MSDAAQPPGPVPPPGRFSRRIVWFVAPFLILAAGAAFFAGYLPKRRTREQLDAAAAQRRAAPPLVNAARVKLAPKTSELLLPGNVTPIIEAYIFARASGYLKSRYVDIGDRVRANQLLAEIDAPDLDQQVVQARAALAQSESQLGQAVATLEQLVATRDLAEITWHRYQVLTASGAVSRQEGDMELTAAKTAEANVTAGEKAVRAAEESVHASQANLQRLITLQGYEQIRAPFPRIITARNVDVGALISAVGASQGPTRPSSSAPSDLPSSGEIFRLAKIDRLRVLVAVPQMYSPGIHVGQTATVAVQERPNLSFAGKVTRTSSSLDATTRTLLTEVQVSNPEGVLLPGMYAQIRFVAVRVAPPFLVPDAALVTRATGTMMAVLLPLSQSAQAQAANRVTNSQAFGALRTVHFVAVQPGRDYGNEIEILNGLSEGQEVAVDPSDAVQEGALVQLVSSGGGQTGAATRLGRQ